MEKLLTVIFCLLGVLILAEAYIFLKIKPRRAVMPIANTQGLIERKRETATPNRNQKKRVHPVFDPSDWRPWQPDKVGSYKNIKYGVVYRLQAKIEKFVGNGQIKASGEDGKTLSFAVGPSVEYFSRREKPRQPSTLSKTSPFTLEKGRTYLFEWLESQNKQNSSMINLWRITRLED